MTTRFNNAINALVQAFFTDTLAKGTCTACAVGNICAAAMGAKVVPYMGFSHIFQAVKYGIPVFNDVWQYAFVTTTDGIQKRGNLLGIPECTYTLIAATGYDIDELARVEYAFETNTQLVFDDYPFHTKAEIMEDQYNGLMAVVNVLCEIEGIEDPTEYRQLFEYADRT